MVALEMRLACPSYDIDLTPCFLEANHQQIIV
jgi:hypothetical protein